MEFLFIVILFQLLLVLTCVIGFMMYANYRRSNDEEANIQLLVDYINSHKDARLDTITELVSNSGMFSGETLKNKVDEIYVQESDCYRDLIELFLNREPRNISKIYKSVQKVFNEYEDFVASFAKGSKHTQAKSPATDEQAPAEEKAQTPAEDKVQTSEKDKSLDVEAKDLKAAPEKNDETKKEPSEPTKEPIKDADKVAEQDNVETSATTADTAPEAKKDKDSTDEVSQENIDNSAPEADSASKEDSLKAADAEKKTEEAEEAAEVKEDEANLEPDADAPVEDLSFYQDKFMSYVEGQGLNAKKVKQDIDGSS